MVVAQPTPGAAPPQLESQLVPAANTLVNPTDSSLSSLVPIS